VNVRSTVPRTTARNVSLLAAGLALLVVIGSQALSGTTDVAFSGDVPCSISGPACGAALQAAIDRAPAGATITLDPGRVYEGTIVFPAKTGATAAAPITITTRGWDRARAGWDGLVTPSDKPRLAVLRGGRGAPAAFEIRGGRGSGFVTLQGLAFEATPPAGQGDIIRIGTGREDDPAELPQNVSIRQVLIQGDRDFGQKRGISANGRDILIEQIWCDEVFTAGQDSQCIGAWNGAHRVTVRHSYLAAGAENILIGGAPIQVPAMQPSDWTIEDVILHKPLRWKQDGRNRAVKNLLELKHGRSIAVRRVLAVNNWRAGQSGRGLVIHYTTNGPCPACGNLEQIQIEDFVMLNVEAGVSFQGYSWQPDSHSDGHLQGVVLRNLYVHITGPGRLFEMASMKGRHDIRIERSTFLNNGTGWLMGDLGLAWDDDETRVNGAAWQGLTIVDNVITANGEYGVTAPQSKHYGRGLAAFVDRDLQIAGNVIGDAPAEHLDHYNRHAAKGQQNVSVPRASLLQKLAPDRCGEWQAGKGADCARLAPLFDLIKRLPEP
jgi:hypothetical protein